MKVYTGYYAKLNKYIEDGLFPIAISAKIPEKINNILHWKFFAPSWKIWKNWHDHLILSSTFTSLFEEEILPKVNIDYVKFVFEELKNSNKYNGIILLCYETPEKFCHRHIVAKFLEEQLGIEVKEYVSK